jgi:hypothetical protein
MWTHRFVLQMSTKLYLTEKFGQIIDHKLGMKHPGIQHYTLF